MLLLVVPKRFVPRDDLRSFAPVDTDPKSPVSGGVLLSLVPIVLFTDRKKTAVWRHFAVIVFGGFGSK